MKTLELKNEIIYGPVNSRRIGSSLGINILPSNHKLCTFNCVYCQYGWNPELLSKAAFPKVREITEALRSSLVELGDANCLPGYLTFSGNGEPTMHPDFLEIVNEVKKIRNQLSPGSKVALLSNSTQLDRKRVRDALEMIEMRIMKFDCGSESVFKYYNKPASNISFYRIAENLKDIAHKLPLFIQTLFAGGKHGNYTKENTENWVILMEKIKPAGVQIYTLSRGFPEKSLEPVTRAQMDEIKNELNIKGVQAEVY